MRYNVQGIARDSYGIILPKENINIYKHNTSECATVYSSGNSTEKLDTCPQIQTDVKGEFSVYFDSDDYTDLTITFDFEIEGKNTPKFEDIEVFRVDRRILNTTEVEGESVYDAYNPKEISIDGGTF